MSNQKLELTWIGKDQRPRLEPRILLEDPKRSYHAKQRVTDNDLFDNRLIRGDNLLALKALEAEFAGKVKCVFIDPPYNTGSAFTHYDDGLEHSIWLGLMRDRLEIIRRLLADDGSLWITIDDNEAHYLKVMCDEIFGRRHFVVNGLWQKRTSPDARLHIGDAHDHVLIYAKDKERFALNKLPLSLEQTAQFKNPDNDSRGPWTSADFTAQGWRPNQMYKVKTPSGTEYEPPAGRCWGNVESAFKQLLNENRLWFGREGDARPRVKNFLSEHEGVRAWSWWPNTEVGHNQEAKKEINALFGTESFDTPKPERLIHRIVALATNPGDLVLDSFAGSGTTGAVAHKMGRRWIMVELGEHCHTHIVPRLQKVIAGQDPGGVTQSTGWEGGGGFRYYELAPTLLSTDRWGNLVINPDYDAAMLSAAMCKLEGFVYAPSETLWWQQGRSSECDFIYVTTQTLGPEQLEALSHEVGLDPNNPRSLLVCCGAYRGVTAAQAAQRWPNLTLKKIPKMVKDRCEWGHDDYSLNVANLPMAQKKPVAPAQDDLFGAATGEGA
ncbi:MAG: site-specific DNA-methyltransferase [Betaproteobacteria bacterium HGW-Betaproteobacteria-18]|nr:MAG: site-specific DNA-methyltransferase [Betaproteobacteria bacterium HGW-Betaproteobacteria-18]